MKDANTRNGSFSCAIRYVTLQFRDRRNAASRRYRNRAVITVRMCEQKRYPVWFLRRRKSYTVQCEHGLNFSSSELSYSPLEFNSSKICRYLTN